MITELPKQQYNSTSLEIQRGTEVSLFHYYQPDSTLQFGYDIEWLPIKREQNAVLLLSSKALYCKAFNKTGNVSWDNSSLREWLNGEFLRNSFSHGNEVLLLPTSSENPIQIPPTLPYRLPKEDGFRKKSSDQDYVFLLSEEEIEGAPQQIRMAFAHWIADKTQLDHPHPVKWWLRPSNGNNCINAEGMATHCECDAEDVYVRPAIWVDNFYIQRVVKDTTKEWERLVDSARVGRFSYKSFQKVASQTYDILHLYYLFANTIPTYPKMIVRLLILIAKFSEININTSNECYKLAKNAAESFCLQSINWVTIYTKKQHGLGAINKVFVMNDLAGERIVVDANTFDMEHPLNIESGNFTLY